TGVFGTGTGSTGEAAWKVKRKQSVLDLCKADLTRYQSLKMSKADKDQVSTWLDLLRTTEVGVVPTPPTSCSTITADAAPCTPPSTTGCRTGWVTLPSAAPPASTACST